MEKNKKEQKIMRKKIKYPETSKVKFAGMKYLDKLIRGDWYILQDSIEYIGKGISGHDAYDYSGSLDKIKDKTVFLNNNPKIEIQNIYTGEWKDGVNHAGKFYITFAEEVDDYLSRYFTDLFLELNDLVEVEQDEKYWEIFDNMIDGEQRNNTLNKLNELFSQLLVATVYDFAMKDLI